ncbi:SOS response-associated peptidase family protein [Aquimarina gracilis]|uniref:Abasic site processing protein n=1 Tax=Aquimarina gracilis TaxID=874422 RepID=A0ABU5ZVN8_9FLAO|nr:SOS response-associated peptidase family protein [Aquimarina gracilis]MEB3345933.1 SOS response-associated peptidase family protein [Aquimarina gracilis]
MFKKVSNIAKKELIEREIGATFRFPKLYVPNPVIDGTEESTLSIVTMDNPKRISYAIWGILPNNYVDEWEDFQKVFSTLSVSKENLNSDGFFQEPFRKRRCLIIVTGFFIYHLYNGSLHPYYVYQSNKKPFCLGGIYNILDDGFITCSMLLTKASGIINKIQNLNTNMPILIPKKSYQTWLDPESKTDKINNIINDSEIPKFYAHPIAKEFFKNNISYDSMLAPVYYKNIPLP